jgi:hypothetical protein
LVVAARYLSEDDAAPGSIAGKVTGPNTKKALGGATVDCGAAGIATSAGDGTYSIAGVTPGTYTCTASAPGYRSSSRSVTVTSGGTTRADFNLRKG